MGILSPIIPRYQRELFTRAVDKGHRKLAKRLGEYILARDDNRKVRQGMKAL